MLLPMKQFDSNQGITVMTVSLNFSRHGDKQNSKFFEDYLLRLLEERDGSGLTDKIHDIEAIMITVDPGHSIRYIGELCLMTQPASKQVFTAWRKKNILKRRRLFNY